LLVDQLLYDELFLEIISNNPNLENIKRFLMSSDITDPTQVAFEAVGVLACPVITKLSILQSHQLKKSKFSASNFVQSFSSKNRKLLLLAHEWLNRLLPHIVTKRFRVHYGSFFEWERGSERMSHRRPPGHKFGVPYLGKDTPSPKSEFGHVDIVIGFTIFTYLYDGLTEQEMQQLLTLLQRKAQTETGNPKDRPSCQQFDGWAHRILKVEPTTSVNGINPAHLRLLSIDPHNKNSLSLLAKTFGGDREVIYYYLNECVFNGMTTPTEKLSAGAHEVGSNMLFNFRLGFSGTPNSESLPLQLECVPDRGTNGQILVWGPHVWVLFDTSVTNHPKRFLL
jgi:hypothetical protein